MLANAMSRTGVYLTSTSPKPTACRGAKDKCPAEMLQTVGTMDELQRTRDGFWVGRRVLITGHTGFKGAWLAHWLAALGAEVYGLALPPLPGPGLYNLSLPILADEWLIDIRDRDSVGAAMQAARPELVMHLAAQALVRPSYQDPADTFSTNVTGTAHVLDAIRVTPSVQAALIVTTDKVYENDDSGRPFREDDRLAGKDPYSASKACAELLTRSYKDSFLIDRGMAIATARAGNVIGGGDWGIDRLIPDMVRAAAAEGTITVRYPAATRPWQHVLDCLRGYLLLSRRLLTAPDGLPPAVNFGPPPGEVISVQEVVESLRDGLGIDWRQAPGPHPPEAMALTLDPALARRALGWQTLLSVREAVTWTGDWYRHWQAGHDARELTQSQLLRYAEKALSKGEMVA